MLAVYVLSWPKAHCIRLFCALLLVLSTAWVWWAVVGGDVDYPGREDKHPPPLLLTGKCKQGGGRAGPSPFLPPSSDCIQLYGGFPPCRSCFFVQCVSTTTVVCCARVFLPEYKDDNIERRKIRQNAGEQWEPALELAPLPYAGPETECKTGSRIHFKSTEFKCS